MIRLLDATVNFLFSVLLSLGAILALFLVPPVGIILFFCLHKYAWREFGQHGMPARY